MFALALVLGIYAYVVFGIGLVGLLSRTPLLVITILVLTVAVILVRSKAAAMKETVSTLPRPYLILLTVLCAINAATAFVPELAFDALWYHLTLPKMWLSEGSLSFFPGAVYKYSVMPMLGEMLYITAVSLQGQVAAKLVHFSFGLLTLAATYLTARKFLDPRRAILSVVVLATNLVFAWESTTAYADLFRSFFEIVSLNLLLSRRWYSSATVLGLAAASKLLALTSIPLHLAIMTLHHTSVFSRIKFVSIVVLIISPWLIRAFLATGNPVYPFFSPMYSDTSVSLHPGDIIRLFTTAADPVSPLYLAILPALVLLPRTWFRTHRDLLVYSALALCIWWITPRSGGGRFILPYLPAFSILAVTIISGLSDSILRRFFTGIALVLAMVTIGYRSAATVRYVPLLTGRQSPSQFLTTRLNFSAGDFYDTDGKITSLTTGKKVLVIGINNLFYADFQFVHATVDPDYLADFVLIRYTDASLPKKFHAWNLVYENPTTKVRLYQPPLFPVSQ